MDRTLSNELLAHFADHRQMALLSGPRQVGKTTIALDPCRHITHTASNGLLTGQAWFGTIDSRLDRTLGMCMVIGDRR